MTDEKQIYLPQLRHTMCTLIQNTLYTWRASFTSGFHPTNTYSWKNTIQYNIIQNNTIQWKRIERNRTEHRRAGTECTLTMIDLMCIPWAHSFSIPTLWAKWSILLQRCL